MPSLISNTVSLVGGAVVGAAAMYLLDPDQGESRRKDVSSTAADALFSTRDAVRTTANGAADSAHSVTNTVNKYAKGLAGQVSDHVADASDTAHSLAGTVSKYAKGLASHVGDQVSDASDSAHSWAHRLSAAAKRLADHVTDHVSGAADSASDAAGRGVKAAKAAHAQTRRAVSDAADSAQSYGSGLFGRAKAKRDDLFDQGSKTVAKAQRAAHDATHESPSHATGLTIGTIGVLALGAGLMYYLDPERGRTRRALARDKMYSTARQSGHKMRSYGHHLGNKVQGYAAEVRQAIPAQWVDGGR